MKSTDASEPESFPAQVRLSWPAHLFCGWPLGMIFVGGALGGGLGGLAYGLNLSIYRSALPGRVKIALNLCIGFLAFAIWLTAAMVMNVV